MKTIKRFFRWLSKRIAYFLAFLLFSVGVLLIWFFVTGFSQSQASAALGIAAISTFFAAISSIASLVQATEAQKQREGQERPYVIAYFDGNNRGAMLFVIENRGNSPATNISFKFDPPPIDHANRPLNEVSLFKKPIDFLPPGKIFKQVIDAGHRFIADGKQLEYKVTVSYSSVSGDPFEDTTEFDLSYLKQATIIGKSIEENLEDIAKNLKTSNDMLRSIKGMNSLLVESPNEYNERLERMQNRDEDIPSWKRWLKNILTKILSRIEQ